MVQLVAVGAGDDPLAALNRRLADRAGRPDLVAVGKRRGQDRLVRRREQIGLALGAAEGAALGLFGHPNLRAAVTGDDGRHGWVV